MADAAAAEDGKPPVVVSAGIPMKMVIIIVVATLLLGIGAAFAIFRLTSGGHGGEEAKTEANASKAESHGEADPKHASADTKSGGAKVPSPGVMFDVEPFIVNLADPQEVRYLKLTVKLEMDNQEGADALTQRIPQVRDTILVLLTSKESSSIRTTQGKFQLRDEITQRVNSLLPKPAVHTAYFTEFVVQ